MHPQALGVSGVRATPKRADHVRTRKQPSFHVDALDVGQSRGGSGDYRGRASGDRGTGTTAAGCAGQPEMGSVGAPE